MSYNKYPKEVKDAVVARMLSGEETAADIYRETKININTLYRWRDAAALLVLRKKADAIWGTDEEDD